VDFRRPQPAQIQQQGLHLQVAVVHNDGDAR
jgi:hypothetical protein